MTARLRMLWFVLMPLLIAAAPAPPAILTSYIKDGVFDPGDYRWMRGRFDDASLAEKARFATVAPWQSACFEAGMADARARLRAMGTDPARLERGGYTDDLCASFASSFPWGGQTASWPTFERDLAIARPSAAIYLFATTAARESLRGDASVRSLLLAMPVREQMLRKAMTWGAGDAAALPPLSDGVRPIVLGLIGHATDQADRANTRRLAQIIDDSGWPGTKAVGPEASGNAWLMAQHADHDPAFQLRVLRLMEPMATTGDVSKSDHAYLHDRVMLKIAGKQRFGTQATCNGGRRTSRPLEDADAVERQRSAVGLEPLAHYLAMLDRTFGPCPPDVVPSGAATR